MRLRKFAEGRILGEAKCNWVDRQLAFSLPGPAGTPPNWLLLDCRHGPAILYSLPETFAVEPEWPDTSLLPALTAPEPDTGENASWKRFQVLTPLLRRTLAALDPLDAAALLVDLEAGGGDLFWYTPASSEGAPPLMVSAWPLPPALEKGVETVTTTTEDALPLLEALSLPLLLADAKTQANAPTIKEDKSSSRRRTRLLEKLEEERKRLEGMLLLGDDARLIQAHLWHLTPDERLEEIRLPLDSADPEGEARTVPLNSLISVTENMQFMFRKAAKAARGLAMLEKRLELARHLPPTPVSRPEPLSVKETRKKGKKTAFSPSLIQEFRSSDGLALWRGRSAEGNRALLKLARPFDLWFHVEDGPSAHLLIRRDHAAHEVPDRTLREAAILVGNKSWRKNDPRASIMIALAKHVQPVKGAGPGTVRVQEQWRSILVPLDETLETLLRPETRSPAAMEGTSCIIRK